MSQITLNRHSGACQNLVKTITYWMLVFTSMTKYVLDQRFPNYILKKLQVSARQGKNDRKSAVYKL